MKNPLLILASCFALGILVARRWTFSNVDTALLIAAQCMLAGLCFLRAGWARTAGASALIAYLMAGIAGAGVFQNRFAPNDIRHLGGWGLDLSRPVIVQGIIASAPMQTASGFSFDLDCQQIDDLGRAIRVRGRARIRLFVPPNLENWTKLDQLHLSYGDAIRAPIRLERPTVYRNPGSFNFRWRLQFIEDITWEGNIKTPLAVEKLSNAQGLNFPTFVATIRGRLLHGLDRLYPPWSADGRAGGVLKAALLGDRSSLDAVTSEYFRESGLYHLLVISGLNVALLAEVILYFLSLCRVKDSLRQLLLFTFLAVYALLVEQSAPTLRAFLMISTYLLAQYLYRGRGSLNAIGFTALALLVYRPAWLFEAGFQLSFLAALLIAGLAVPILERTTSPFKRAMAHLDNVEIDANIPPRCAQFRLDLRMLIKWAKRRCSFLAAHPSLAEQGVVLPANAGLWLLELIAFSAVLQIGLLMPMAVIFHRITLVGVGLNAVAIPLMTILLGLSAPTVLLAVLSPAIAAVPGRLLLWVTNGVLAVTEFRAYPHWLSYRVPEPPFWVAFGCALSLLVLAWSLAQHRVVFAASLTTFTLLTWLLVSYPFSPKIPHRMLEMTALDCGAGEGIFAVLPDGTTLLMNTGGRERFGSEMGRWNPGEEIVSPYLWSRGIRKIDIVVLGGNGIENIKATDAVLRNFQVGQLWRGSRAPNPADDDLANTARERNVPIRQIAQGDQETRGKATIQVLWPPSASQELHSPQSDRAPILRISAQDRSILWRGGNSERVTRAMNDSANFMLSDILATARPLTSSPAEARLLDRIQPKVVVISGGRNFGGSHNSLAYQQLQARGVQVFRTVSDGAVSVRTDASHLEIQHFPASEDSD